MGWEGSKASSSLMKEPETGMIEGGRIEVMTKKEKREGWMQGESKSEEEEEEEDMRTKEVKSTSEV